ncbi:MAG TPA: VWA domain-containing protein [Vicinamibacteria bacterium]|nr:VWA domain-containing protein [Vicinamibacteria bacterium]
MGTPRRLRPCLCLFAVLALVPPLRAQAPAKAEVLPPVGVEVVRIDAVVTDKGGHPKAGLARDDFAVLEDGVPQKLVQFEAYARPAAAAPSSAAGSPSMPAADEQAASPRPPRFVVLAVDDVHVQFANMARVQKALTRFIDEDIGPGDRVALVTTSGAQGASQDFTSDRGLLQQAISRLSAKDRRAEWVNVPRITEYQAELIERGDPDALWLAVMDILCDHPADPAELEARLKARAVLSEAVDNSRLTLETLERLTRGLASLPGRKVIFLLSDGFLTGLSAPGGAGFDIRRVIDASTRAGVVIYSLETPGLNTAPGRSASENPFPDPQTLEVKFTIERQSEEAALQAMHALAADTGGFLFDNSNDLHAGLKRTLEDTDSYYVLAYEPTNTKRDGAYRHIEVRLPNQRNLKVRARTGYFAPGERRASPPSIVAETGTRGVPAATAAALAPLPVQLSADFVSVDRGVSEVVVSGHVDTTTLAFVRDGDRYKAALEMAAVVRDEAGTVVATEPERLSMDLTEAERERLSREGLSYQKTVTLKRGTYDVLLTAGAAGALGEASQRVEVPDLAPGRLTLSSLFLLKAGAGTEAAGPGGDLVLSQAVRRFRRDESLFVQLYAYNAKRDSSGATSLVSQAEVLRGGAVLAKAAPEPVVTGEGDGTPVPHVSRIGLGSFEPGEYELQVTVTDRNANEAATRQVEFTVD